MLFNSLHFVVFFPVVCLLYFSLKMRFRWVLIVIASYYFYACWRSSYLVLIVASTLVDYVAGLGLGHARRLATRRSLLGVSIATNLGLLFFFKYYGFFAESASLIGGHFNITTNMPELKVLLPVGISFYTFQTMSYTIDVYRRRREPERHLGIFASYVAFFPQLVAGPIERSTHLLPQFRRLSCPDAARFAEGLRHILWGFFKKLVIADGVASFVNSVYGDPGSFSGMTVVLATYLFAFQIYCDFSGYSDIAIGCSKVLGFDLRCNFQKPYFAGSLRDFWRRWHISLSSWFRDYLYIPLGGSRGGALRAGSVLLVVFLLSGLWHGAAWNFVLWGFFHGAALILENWLFKRTGKALKGHVLARAVRMLITFHVVLLGWVLFRVENILDLGEILSSLGRPWGITSITLRELITCIGAIAFMLMLESASGDAPVPAFIAGRKKAFRWLWYHAVMLAIVFFGVFDQQEFIYFQF